MTKAKRLFEQYKRYFEQDDTEDDEYQSYDNAEETEPSGIQPLMDLPSDPRKDPDEKSNPIPKGQKSVFQDIKNRYDIKRNTQFQAQSLARRNRRVPDFRYSAPDVHNLYGYR